MWYRWTKVIRADIPPEHRTQFEDAGEAVVAQLAGSPISFGSQVHITVPPWAMSQAGRQLASAWLRERESRRERRQDQGETVEMAILVLVAIEAIPIAISAVKHIF